jgi:hypothetical protein
MTSSSNISAGGGTDKRKSDKISTSPRSNRLEENGYLKGLYKWKYVSNSNIYETDGSYKILVNFKPRPEREPKLVNNAIAYGYATEAEALGEEGRFLYCIENCLRRSSATASTDKIKWNDEWINFNDKVKRDNCMRIAGQSKFWELDDTFIRARNAINNIQSNELPPQLETEDIY